MLAEPQVLTLEEYFARRYYTIVVSIVVIGGTWASYLWNVSPVAGHNDANQLTQRDTAVAISIALGLLLGVAFFLASGKAYFGVADLPIPLWVRRRVLPGVTVAYMIVLGSIMVVSGGWASPFTNYLSATTSVALILAERRQNKLIILGTTCVIYWVASSWVVFSGSSSGAFNKTCFLLAILLAALAGWKNSPNAPQQ